MTIRLSGYFLYSTGLLMLAIGAPPKPAYAETWTRQCDAVIQSAELQYDSSLVVNVAKDNSEQRCVFFVSPGPLVGGQNTSSSAASIFQTLSKSTEDPAVVAQSVQKDLLPLLLTSLLEPLTSGRFKNAQADTLIAAVNDRTKSIEACSDEFLLDKKSEFKPRDDVISCGVRDTIFELQASVGSLTLSLLFAT